MIIIGVIAAITVAAGIVRTAQLIQTDGYGRVPTRLV